MALGSRVSSYKMGIKDDICYTTFEAPVECFPRVKYFQSKLKGLFSRFQRLHEPIPDSLKPPKIQLSFLNDAMQQVTVSSPELLLFGPTHSTIPKRDLVMKFRDMKYDTHLLEEIPSYDDKEKKHKLLGVICTLRMIGTLKGKETLLKLKDCVGVENMLFFVDAEYESNKDLVDNNLEWMRGFLKHQMTVVYQSENKLSTAISDHMEQKFINAFNLLNQYLLQATEKTTHLRGRIFGQEDAKEQLVMAIAEFFKTPLTILDLFLTTEPAFAEKAIEIATVFITRNMLIGEIVNTYKLQVIRVTDYLEEVEFNKKCALLLEALHKPHLITQLQEIAEKHKEQTSVANLRSANELVDQLFNLYENQHEKRAKSGLRKEFEPFPKAIAMEAANALLNYFLDIGNNIRDIRIKLDLLACVRKELLRMLEKTIDEKKYDEVMPELQKWRDRLESIKEIKAVGHICGQLYVFVQKPESGERASEVQTKIIKYLVDYPGEILVEYFSVSRYAGGFRLEGSKEIAIGDAFLCNAHRGTIGLFMYKMENASKSLHFLTSSHVVLESAQITTADTNPVPLGERSLFFTTEDNLLDIAVIQIHEEMSDYCNPFFTDDNEPRECSILDMDGIKNLKEFEHVYKIGSTSGLTEGCILSADFQPFGLNNHNFVIGVLPGCEDEIKEVGFAQNGDSGSVVYTEPAPNEIQYISILMGELESDQQGSNSSIADLKQKHGPLIVTSCLREGLNQIEEGLTVKLILPTTEVGQPEEQ